jgi:ribosomal protein L15E
MQPFNRISKRLFTCLLIYLPTHKSRSTILNAFVQNKPNLYHFCTVNTDCEEKQSQFKPIFTPKNHPQIQNKPNLYWSSHPKNPPAELRNSARQKKYENEVNKPNPPSPGKGAFIRMQTNFAERKKCKLPGKMYKKRKHQAASCYPMFSGGEKNLFMLLFLLSASAYGAL